MNCEDALGRVVILNGAPRSGKSSIAAVIQESFPGLWMNLGVDTYMRMTPKAAQPGIGLRPGGERPEMEPMIEKMYLALYESIAAHSRRGIHVVADFSQHGSYAREMDLVNRCAALLDGLPVCSVGVHCPVEEIMRRRIATWGAGHEPDGRIPAPVLRWQSAVHEGRTYDIEVDTAQHTPEECAGLILRVVRERYGLGS